MNKDVFLVRLNENCSLNTKFGDSSGYFIGYNDDNVTQENVCKVTNKPSNNDAYCFESIVRDGWVIKYPLIKK